MFNILNSILFGDRKNDIESVIFNKGDIKIYDLKIPFCLNKPTVLPLKRKIRNNYTFEMLDTCDKDNRFVVHPEKKIQITKYGGTVKLMRLEPGYKVEKIEIGEENKGTSGEFGLNIVGAGGVNIKVDNSQAHKFKFEMGELTHEHLVLVIDAILEPHTLRGKYDSINVNLEYITISKTHEKHLTDAIMFEKTKIFNQEFKKT